MLVRLCASSPRPSPLDLESQQLLSTYLRDCLCLYHFHLCVDTVAPMTARLAFETIVGFDRWQKKEGCRAVLDSFWGKDTGLPEQSITSPVDIHAFYQERRLSVCRSKYLPSSDARIEDLENEIVEISPPMLTRLICCRAAVASAYRDDDKKQWWLMAMDLWNAFPPEPPGKGPETRPERTCAFDLVRLRLEQPTPYDLQISRASVAE